MRYPLGIQTFSKIIEDNLLYIDKTAIIDDLIQQGSVYFFSRPRRFGKSLLISTLEALFSGHKNLFEGLAIADSDYPFTVYPVIRMDFSDEEFNTADDLRAHIHSILNEYAQKYDITLNSETFAKRFKELLAKLQDKTGQAVVLLVDEYDKPILNNLKKPVLGEIKAVISAFYAAVKAQDKYLRFVFITGVSKFAKVSVFSGMNNMTDISMDNAYATLCGVTQQELEHHFDGAIDDLVTAQNGPDRLSKDELLAKIRYWYNGYRFEEDAPSVYNPYSLLSLFTKKKFKNYWFTTATPTFLLNLLQDKQYDLSNLSQLEIGDSAFAATEPEDMDVLSLFVQTGYLTIKGYNDPLYVLDFPNYEVKRSFYDSVAARFGHLNTGLGQAYTVNLIQQLNAGDLDAFFATLNKFFANIPYDISIDEEKYYQSLFYAIFTLLGLSIEVEVRTNKGRMGTQTSARSLCSHEVSPRMGEGSTTRTFSSTNNTINCVLQTEDVVYIIEFKLKDSKEAALKQIHTKQYAQKYHNCGKSIVLLGVEFDQKSRNIGDFVKETL
ncbi:MAG: AAA family ATPase [Algicola sp.]|nr:AAA family ATPase [Algicola sp.]